MSAGSGRKQLENEVIVMIQYDYAIFIGRMQPPHKEHIKQIEHGLEISHHVIIALGSHRAAPNIKNPWTAEQREEMIRSCFPPEIQQRLFFIKVRDYYYNDTTWFTDLYNNINGVLSLDYRESKELKLCVTGCKKDASSWYLDMLPENWVRELTFKHNIMNATDVRNLYFAKDLKFTQNLPDPVISYLQDISDTPLMQNLSEEWNFIQDYKKMWAQAPYPVTFVTTDAVVVKNGHILVVKRKFNPGKGLLALPGGFLDQKEKIQGGMLRELKEETRILMPKHKLEEAIVDKRVFDHPERSTRGRTITHAFCIKLPDGGQLPQVKGSDDAEHALWIPIADLYIRENEFYEDHLHIATYFVNKL